MIIVGKDNYIVIDSKHFCTYTIVDYETSAGIVALNAMTEAKTLLGEYPNMEAAKSALGQLSMALSDDSLEIYYMGAVI